MYASYGLNSRTQLSWPPIIHRLTFLITIQGRRNVKNLDGNKPIRWAGSAPRLLPLIGVGLTYWQNLVGTSSPHFFIRSGGSDYSQEMHNYKYISLHTYFLAFKSLSLCFDEIFLFHDGHP